jgi:GntR family transcriptional regulator/MocR family aminotransferase
VPDAGTLDWTTWRRLSARALRRLAGRAAAYASEQGQPALRAAIARHVSFARALSCDADDIVVVAGAQQGFDLIARALVKPASTVVAMEDPGYPPARAAFAAAGAKVVPVRVDAEGIVVDELPPQARIVYVTPAHQFPLGCVLSARRRAALLDFARSHKAAIVEDDYDGEFRYDGRPHDALKTIDRWDAVFFVGTFSKCLFPGLRLGYVVPPPWALGPLVQLKRLVDWHCNVPAQDTLADFIGQGHLARHVRRMRGIYAERRNLLIEALREPELERRLDLVPGTSGLHLAALARQGLDIDAIIDHARRAGIGIYSIDEYRCGAASPRGLLFGYGAIESAAMKNGLGALRRLLPAG